MEGSEEDRFFSEGRLFDNVDCEKHATVRDVLLAGKVIPSIGLVLNIVFLFVTVRVKSMHTIVNVYLSNLAVADALYLLQMSILLSISPRSVAENAIQIVGSLMDGIARYASHSFVTALAIERFLGVHHPITFRATASKTRAAKICGGLWFLSVILGVITSLLANAEYLSSDITTNTTCFLIYNILLVIFFSSTFVITASVYIYIMIKLHYQTQASRQRPQPIGQVIRMLLINTAVFFLLNSIHIATAIISIQDRFLTHIELLHLKVGAAAVVLDLINCSIDPLVYSATNSTYRTAVIEAFSFMNPARYCNCQRYERPKTVSGRRELHKARRQDAATTREREQMELSGTGPRQAAQEPAQIQLELSTMGLREPVQEPEQVPRDLCPSGPMEADQEPGQDPV